MRGEGKGGGDKRVGERKGERTEEGDFLKFHGNRKHARRYPLYDEQFK